MNALGGRQLRAGGWKQLPALPLPFTDARLFRAERLVLTVEAVRRLAPGGGAGGAAARRGDCIWPMQLHGGLFGSILVRWSFTTDFRAAHRPATRWCG
jgi:hypothetical protein